MSAPATDAPESAPFPPGLNNAFLFATFNALSFPVIIGSPMILYAKSLGASATVLGIIAGMLPLLVIFQIPAARHLSRVGYRRFVYAGWGIRIIFILGLSLVPLTGRFLDPTARLCLVLLLLFGFNLSRGISSCAWLPWITSLVPETMRGQYLVRDAACVNLAGCGVIVLSALVLGDQPVAWRFAVVFAFSAAMGAVSLVFLKRIPEVTAPEASRGSVEPVPWSAIAAHPPFRKLLRVNVVCSLAIGGLGAFTVAWLKTEAQLVERDILLATSSAYLGGLGSLWLLGPRLDRLGSKPVLTFCMLGWLGIMAVWVLLAGRMLAPATATVLGLQFGMGLANSLVSMANLRLAMAIIPPLGRDHFFALFSVVGSLMLGLSPILWGLFLDALHGLDHSWHGLSINRYTLFFALNGVTFIVALALCRRLEEPKAASMEALLRDLLIESPLRVWLRLWPRA